MDGITENRVSSNIVTPIYVQCSSADLSTCSCTLPRDKLNRLAFWTRPKGLGCFSLLMTQAEVFYYLVGPAQDYQTIIYLFKKIK